MTEKCRCGDHHAWAGPNPQDRPAAPRQPLLATTLAREDRAEDTGGLDPTDRVTCRTHRRWLHECVSSPVHANSAIGYRWCRRCDHQALVAVDELTGEVAIRCGLCGRSPRSRANDELVALCRRSLALSRASRFPESAAA
ncbi:hypothetical protein [Amycolatopsis sp. WQ 127309]|uniref:hypothetical protein n=1 Tax=Amycolatopsis sp. WQ 127309 TaxID=2932773 RepID=UPI001FF2F657|nr:hypothetical protein [Amycolatopsis sp. WQ 127309]UOZ04180.1 hypothetical protein MUY22_35820 [Amycolatopsis sp. WQ 127309]